MILGLVNRGFTLDDFDNLEPWEVVDLCITYNNANIEGESSNEPTTRKASQDDFDNF